ncbi:MAG: hypothetical protein J4O01_00260 [Chloroflexi bacterium]|nr:hypothetical protein [Chloroflexota bacterium]MCH8113935.1 hypothetical protein [Chloroflexota bacterium]MCI0774212.1 hypothetical protein [Chloroflexota bacterium]MCI0804229.1 hypothetical protein [Chloroflexota bacterium]MCI0807804.1 hypothetical protein [Chloroflexota bacterium]
MTSAETIAQIKDIVVILFLAFATMVVIVASVVGVRLYWRVGRFMDRMEKVADRLESTFYGVAIAGRALRPMASGLGLLGVAQGVGRLFGLGRKGSNN